MENKTGFTLAEVLITLGIIGVVAAMTIPTLVKDYQKTQYVTGFKKVYAQFNQVLQQMAADHGSAGDLRGTGLFVATSTTQQFGDIVANYIKITNNCQMNANNDCGADFNKYIDGTDITGAYTYFASASYYKFISADGVSYALRNLANDCNTPTYTRGITGNLSQTCGLMFVDINGRKPPNFEGRDVFRFYITNGKGPLLYPAGGADDNFFDTSNWWKNWSPTGCSNSPGTYKYGFYCAGRIMEEGWQMNY